MLTRSGNHSHGANRHWWILAGGIAFILLGGAAYLAPSLLLAAVLLILVISFAAYRSGARFVFQPSANTVPPKNTVLPSHNGSGDVKSLGLVEEMLHQGRFALLLRRQIIDNLSPEQLQRTLNLLSDRMALLPEGEVELQPPAFPDEFGDFFDTPVPANSRVVRVGRVYVDRYLVSNEDFSRFVQAGCYEQMAIWDPEIWPAVLNFVDRTGRPGPRFWSRGRCGAGLETHPVAGISWYEAHAYARWVGKRLLTDAEWVKSAAWPVALSPTSRVQRRFPWGDHMDRDRANLWHSGVGNTVPVDCCEEGISTGGVHQLVGNVWEWTSSPLSAEESPFGRLALDLPMKVVRGGAFDTYFESQADTRFSSCENPVERKHNIGFRCAINARDLVTQQEGEPAKPESLNTNNRVTATVEP